MHPRISSAAGRRFRILAGGLALCAAGCSRGDDGRGAVEDLRKIGMAFFQFGNSRPLSDLTIRGVDGKALLSWRVALLPQLGQEALYREFHLDEPWDSEHNRTLLARMPDVYALPGAPATPGMTHYRSFSGPKALFDPARQPRNKTGLFDVTDGLPHSLCAVESKEAVEWTRPDNDIAVPPGDGRSTFPAEALGASVPHVFHAAFFDATVAYFHDTIPWSELAPLTTITGEEAVNDPALGRGQGEGRYGRRLEEFEKTDHP